MIKLLLDKITTEEEIKIPSYHYTELNGKTTLHATSNLPLQLQPSQLITAPMPAAIKPNAKNPGSIISQNVNSIE